MRGIIFVFIFGFLLITGCVEEETASGMEVPGVETPESGIPGIKQPETINETGEFSAGSFSIGYPENWQDVEIADEPTILNKGYGYCAMAVNRFGYFTPNLLKLVVEDYMQDEPEWNGNGYEGNFVSDDGTEFYSKNRILYCNCATYLISVACAEDNFDEKTADEIIDSAKCDYEFPPAYDGKGKLGIVIAPPGEETFMEVYCENLKESRNAGIYLSHMYFSWGKIETSEGVYNWSVPDYVVEMNELNDMKMSGVVMVIYTNQIGELPSDVEFTSFKDEKLKERFADFMIEFLDRYGETMEYVEIGNEVNIYLEEHPDEIDDFKEFYSYVYDKIKEKHPETKVSTIFAYHAAKETDSVYIIEDLADVGDFNAFTLYIYGDKFAFDGVINNTKTYFDGIEEISDKPFAMVETGWSTSPMLKSSEEKQVEYIDEVFDILEEKKDKMEFFGWFDSNDVAEENCEEIAESFISESMGEDIKENEYWAYFEEFICTLGLRDVDNNPKLGWDEWISKSREYTGID